MYHVVLNELSDPVFRWVWHPRSEGWIISPGVWGKKGFDVVQEQLWFTSRLPFSDHKWSIVHGICGLNNRHVKQLNVCVGWIHYDLFVYFNHRTLWTTRDPFPDIFVFPSRCLCDAKRSAYFICRYSYQVSCQLKQHNPIHAFQGKVTLLTV